MSVKRFLASRYYECYYTRVADKDPIQQGLVLENYSRGFVFMRWLFLAIEAGLAIYFVITTRLEIGILFIAYGVVCLFLLLPLIRCVRCSYYGKRCNFGWGQWISTIFPKDEKNSQEAYYGYTMLFWPLRGLPILIGLYKILQGLLAKFYFVPQGLFGIYLVVLFLQRRFYRSRACPRCQEAANCPVLAGKNPA